MLLSAVMVMGLLAGCGGSGDSASSDASSSDGAAAEGEGGGDGEFTIAVIPKLISIPYFTQTGEGAEQAGEDLGINVIYNGPTTADAAQQVTMIEDYITQGRRRNLCCTERPGGYGICAHKSTRCRYPCC